MLPKNLTQIHLPKKPKTANHPSKLKTMEIHPYNEAENQQHFVTFVLPSRSSKTLLTIYYTLYGFWGKMQR